MKVRLNSYVFCTDIFSASSFPSDFSEPPAVMTMGPPKGATLFTSKFVPGCRPRLSRYCSILGSSSKTLTMTPFSLALRSESCTVLFWITSPFLSGMGYPWGQVSGLPSFSAIFSSISLLMECSSLHASSWTLSHSNPSMSVSRRSESLCFLITFLAAISPSPVNITFFPMYLMSPFCSSCLSISETEDGLRFRCSAIFEVLADLCISWSL